MESRPTDIQLIPPDCLHSDAIIRLSHSLQAFQRISGEIMQKAVARVDHCKGRLVQLGKRMEMLESKLDVLDQVDGVPLLHCASKYPAGVGSPGVSQIVFTRTNWKSSFVPSPADVNLKRSEGIHPSTSKEAFLRKQGHLPLFKKSRQAESSLFNADRLTVDDSSLKSPLKSKPSERVGDESLTCIRAKSDIDFSESLLDVCNQLVGSEEDFDRELDAEERFFYEPSELDQLAEFDLPENLPGIDMRNLVATNPPSRSDVSRSGVEEEQKIFTRQKSPSELSSSISVGSNVTQFRMADEVHKVEEKGESERYIHNAEVAKLAAPSAAPPPPPPPPPPPSMAPIPSTSQQPPKTQTAGREDLMAAIRAAGGMQGAKLKKLDKAEREKEEKPIGNVAQAQPAAEEDLMSSLRRVLASRRRDIAGRTPSEGTKPAASRGDGGGQPLSALRERVAKQRLNDSSEQQPEEEDLADWS